MRFFHLAEPWKGSAELPLAYIPQSPGKSIVEAVGSFGDDGCQLGGKSGSFVVVPLVLSMIEGALTWPGRGDIVESS